MDLDDLIQYNIDHEQCLQKLKDIERHHNYFRDTFSIEPDLVSIGHLGVIIKVGGPMFKPWLKVFGRWWYWHIVPCQNCGKMIREWLPFANSKGMKKALVAPEKGGDRFLCLLCTLPTRGIHEKIRRHRQEYYSPGGKVRRLRARDIFRVFRHRPLVGSLGLVTDGGKYWPFGIVTEGGRVKKRIIEKLRAKLIGRSIQQVSYVCGDYTIILDDDTELKLPFHDVQSLRTRK